MARPDKATAVAELADRFKSSSATVLTEYRGLSVAQLKELRRSLGEGTTYAVVKNTLTKIAAKEASKAQPQSSRGADQQNRLAVAHCHAHCRMMDFSSV